MQRRSYVTVAALMIGLALGAVFGPSVAGLSVGAQTQPPAQTQTSSPAPTQAPSSSTGSTLRELFLDQLAAALNIQRSALDSAITSAGVGTADTAVQQGTLTQAQADALKARIQAGDLGALWGGRGGRFGGPGGAKVAGVHQAILNAAAQQLNMTTNELMTQLRSGQTLAQLAQTNNTTEQAVIDAALAAAKTQLDQAVANGTLTQAQADAAYAELQQRGSNLIVPRGRGPGGHGRHAPPADQRMPASPAPSSSTSGDA